MGNEHVHVSGIDAVTTALYVLVIFGTLNLLAKKNAESAKKNKILTAYAYIMSPK